MLTPFIKNERFTYCYPISEKIILIGTNYGRILQYTLKDLEDIININFSGNRMAKVLEKEPKQIFKFNRMGDVRKIDKINNENILIINEFGGIILDNKNKNDFFIIQNCIGDKYNKIWNFLVLDENNFITIGNYHQIKHWKKSGDTFIPYSISGNGSGIFCLDWFDYEKKIFLTNDYRGNTELWQYEDEKIRKVHSFYINPNLQKCLSLENQYIISTDFFGRIFIYKKNGLELKKIEQFSISLRKGNWVHLSNELDMILIGTNDYLFLLRKDFSEIFTMDIEVKQILTINGIDLILTSKNIVRADFKKKKTPKKLQKYQYIKIGLIGESQVGKTCFCEYLDSKRFRSTESSFGKHVWTIKYKDNRRILLFDLAGQESELFTYFPMIKDSDIILLFYQGINQRTFDQVIEYYKELKYECPKSLFYFIQTFSEQKQRINDFYIKEKFEEEGLNIEENLVKISSKEGSGFDEFYKKVIDNYNWENAHIVSKLNIYDVVENKIHELFKANVKSTTIDELYEEIGTIDKIRLERIVESYYEQGLIEYIKDKKEIILNDEDYVVLHSDIAQYITQKAGYVYTKELIANLGEDQKKKRYIKNILNYYKDNSIGIFFKEDESELEVLIFKKKLSKKIKIPDEIRDYIPQPKYIFEYLNKDLEIDSFLHFLGQFPLILRSISHNKLLFQIKNIYSNIIFIEININLGENNKKLCKIGFSTNKDNYKDLEKKILEFIIDLIGKDLKFLTTNENQNEIGKIEEPIEELKILLKTPSERSFLDFKRQLNLESERDKAKFIKTIIALANSSYSNNNKAYLLIGIEEKMNKIISLQNVEKINILEQKISELVDKFVNIAPTINLYPINVNDMYQLQKMGEISPDIPFLPYQKEDNCKDRILMIKIQRNSGQVFELSREITFQENGKQTKLYKSQSWFRISSHTYIARENLRQMLRTI
ncbi:MAG: RNA-binding domain-containing protein [Promethearchaeota archaeon]